LAAGIYANSDRTFNLDENYLQRHLHHEQLPNIVHDTSTVSYPAEIQIHINVTEKLNSKYFPFLIFELNTNPRWG